MTKPIPITPENGRQPLIQRLQFLGDTSTRSLLKAKGQTVVKAPAQHELGHGALRAVLLSDENCVLCPRRFDGFPNIRLQRSDAQRYQRRSKKFWLYFCQVTLIKLIIINLMRKNVREKYRIFLLHIVNIVNISIMLYTYGIYTCSEAKRAQSSRNV